MYMYFKLYVKKVYMKTYVDQRSKILSFAAKIRNFSNSHVVIKYFDVKELV